MRIVVTGGAGFIGSHVVDALVARGHDVTVIDSFTPAVHVARPDYLNRHATYVDGDVLDGELLDRALAGVDAVAHHAAIVGLGAGTLDGPLFARTNDVGTAELLRAALRCRVPRLLLASSMVVYGEGAYHCGSDGAQRAMPRRDADLAAGRFDPTCPRCGGPLEPGAITEDAPLDPRSVYAATKVHQEHLAFVAMREGGPAVTALRYHNVYGPRTPRDTLYAGVASTFRGQIAAGRTPRVFEDGAQRRDFVHVRDIAEANVRAIERDAPAIGAFNVGSGTPRTILELATALSAALGGRAPTVTGEYRLADVRHIFASSERADRELGLGPRVRFADGVAELAATPVSVVA
ncbi:MAG: NAD-dependent epimerase/dehydratase family protein [Chloroflexota bacterium]|nr:NAD-dependent epimerase/dehydratase family protein [Chloroflexota bacterium]